MNLNNLPDIQFAEKSPKAIETAIITTYEAIAGRTLFPGDPVRLFLASVAAIITQQRVLIDYSAKQNLLRYAAGDYLDHIGVLVGTDRLQPTAATTTLRFTLSAIQPQAVTIMAGTRATPGNNLNFATTQAAEIPTGSLYTDIPAACTETGTAGNGFFLGQINKIVDPFAWLKSVTNITESEGGTVRESDDAYRERIRQAPEQFSCAGPIGSYIYWAKTASQSIIDVAVHSPAAGEVEIRPLMANGELPDASMLDLVASICDDKNIRPLTDKVTVLAPEPVSYDINMTYFIAPENVAQSVVIQQAVTTAVEEYILWQKSKLGRSVNPSELVSRARIAGASRVELASPIYKALTPAEVAIANSVIVLYGGLGDG